MRTNNLNRDMFKPSCSHRRLLGRYSGRVLEHFAQVLKGIPSALITCLKILNVSGAFLIKGGRGFQIPLQSSVLRRPIQTKIQTNFRPKF